MEGRNQLQSASVNIQVNNYGPAAKDSLLSDLDGLGATRAKQAEPIEQAG